MNSILQAVAKHARERGNTNAVTNGHEAFSVVALNTPDDNRLFSGLAVAAPAARL
jgi:hypothetical protein